MNVQHERIVRLSAGLKLDHLPQCYERLATEAAQREASFTEYLETLAFGRSRGAFGSQPCASHPYGGVSGHQAARAV